MIRTHLTPDAARERAARRFADAMDACGYSCADLARHLLVSEKIIRDLRSGLRPLTEERLEMLPQRLRGEYHRRALEDCRGERTHLLTPEGKAQMVSARAADLIGRAIRALADGTLTPDEAQELLEELRPLLADGTELEQQLEELARAGKARLRSVGGVS